MTTNPTASPPVGPTPDTDAVVLDGVRRSYAVGRRGLRRRIAGATSYEAVRGVSLRVARGELFALLGTNGAGKTSTVELVEGLAAPSAGAVRVFGRDPVRDRALVRPRTGVVLQSAGYPPTLTVREMARMHHGTLAGPAAGPAGVDETLEAVGIAHRRDVVIGRLSGGERRRLDIGLAVMGRPELLVLDEPTTGLDPESRRSIWELVRAHQRAGTAVLLTTHYLAEAEDLADRIAIMHEGLIVREGTRAEIVAGAPSRIAFARPEGLRLDDLEVPGARISVDPRGEVVIETADLQPALAHLLAWAGEVRLGGLDARAASLEQVFLEIADGGLRRIPATATADQES